MAGLASMVDANNRYSLTMRNVNLYDTVDRLILQP